MADKQDMSVDYSSFNTLDDIETLPGFIQLPTCAVQGEIYKPIELKDVGDHKARVISFKVGEVLELKPEDLGMGEDLPAVGDMCDFPYMFDNKVGVSNFKQVIQPIAEKLNSRNIDAICEGASKMLVMLIIRREKDKSSGKEYSKIKKLIVL